MNHLRACSPSLAAVFAHVYLPVILAVAGCRGAEPQRRRAEVEPAALSGAASPGPIPKIDVHMHIAGESVPEALEIMREHGIRIGLNASGGFPDEGLRESQEIATATGGRLLPLCNVRLSHAPHPDFERYSRATVQQCKAMGAKGLKIPKSLGLGAVDEHGRLLPVDAPVFDALFDEAGKQGLPVLLHSGDPKAFFQPATPDNERFEELRAHPGWSFYGLSPNGEPWPSWETLLDQFERRVARHPETVFMGAHFGNAAEEPERVGRMLDAHRNLVIDTAARVPEFGRHAAARMRAFFVRYQDRILFGTDLGVSPYGLTLGSSGEEADKREAVPGFFKAHYDYFETDKRAMATPTPIQGRWTIDGIGLPRSVLEKLYWKNAARVFSLRLPPEPKR